MSPSLMLNRRMAVAAGGAALLAGATSIGVQNAMASIRTGGGTAGGGWIQWDGGEAQFSLFASRFNDDELDEPIVVASFIWAEPDGRTLESVRIHSYGPDPDVDTARFLTGELQDRSSGGTYSFSLRVNDLGGPGDQADTLDLLIGPLAPADAPVASPTTENATLSVSGPIRVGDIQLLTFDFETT